MNTNYKRRLERVENMLDFMKVSWTKIKDLFHDECTYYVRISEENEIEIYVKKPSLNRAALTWSHQNIIFNGSIHELSDFIENLKPSNNVVHIR